MKMNMHDKFVVLKVVDRTDSYYELPIAVCDVRKDAEALRDKMKENMKVSYINYSVEPAAWYLTHFPIGGDVEEVFKEAIAI